MRKLKLLLATLTLLVGGALSASAGTDVTASYIGDLDAYSNGGWAGSCENNHKESNGNGWWNTQTGLSGGHSFRDGESWCPNVGSAGVMMGRTMVLPSGNYTLTFKAYGATTNNATDKTVPAAGDIKAFFSGSDTKYDVTNTTLDDATYHDVSYTFDVTTDNTAYTFGIEKMSDESKANWGRIKDVVLTLNSTNIFPVANNSIEAFTYSGSQTWHTNTWSTEGQSDGTRFQVPFHELWVASGGKLDDATISGSYTPTETGVYKVSAWVRAANESGGVVTGLKIFVGDAETDACTGSAAMGGKARLGTYTAMADGVSGTPFSYGFKIKDATINWLAFKNVVITYIGSLPDEDVNALITQAEALEAQEMDADIKSALTTAKTNLASVKSVANYNALVSAISDAQASANAYALFAPEKTKAIALGMTSEAIAAVAPDVNALKVAEYNFVTTNYSHAVELGVWNATGGTGTMTGQHWDGTGESSYMEQSGENWGKNSWTIKYDQDITLPAGNYVFKVAGRTANNNGVTMGLVVKQGETTLGTVNDFPRGDTGKGIDTGGATNFGDGTYANDNKGRGWEWRYVKFTLASPATVNVAVTASATVEHMWVGFCNATVQTDNADNVTLMEALVALNSAKTNATLTKSTNAGTGIFQYNETTNNTLWSAYETAKGNADAYSFTSSSTASEVNALATALNTAINNYNNQALNAPATDKRYTLTIVENGKDWNGNAITFIAGGRNDMGNYAIQYLAAANANLNQALKFTAVDGEVNTYKLSAVNAETGAEQYITTGSTYDGGNNSQIRTTDDASKASWVKIKAAETANQFQLLNVSDGNKVIANNNDNGVYTAGNANFTIAEASQATVNITIDAAVKYATRIFPFTPALPSGVKAYSCAAAEGNTLTLAEVATPAANKPYILEAESGCASTDLNGWGIAGAVTVEEGLLTGVYSDTDAPVGYYVLQNQSDVVGFYKVAESKQPKVKANRCYLTVPSSAREAYFFDGEATAIDALEMLTSGKATIYNASGAEVPALQKGMNIIKTNDGKVRKVLVK